MSKVCVIKTNPGSVLDDYKRMMRLAEAESVLPKENSTIIKLNLSWTKFFPACSTPPWQLNGVLGALREFGYKDLVAVENQTVVTHPWKGAYNNKWLPVLEKYDVDYIPLTNVEWIPYQPKSEMLAMYDIFEEILLPKMFFGKNMIHLPTVKTHGHTTTTGSMKNAFGGLIPKYRHHAHRKIHEILVDLLAIQREIHPGIFTAMDGCVCGNGAGPRTMKPFIGNIILASDDPVSIDAAAAKIMGFDPMKIDYIRIAHDRGLGNGDIEQVEIFGLNQAEFGQMDFGFEVSKSPIIFGDQMLRKKTVNIKWLHKILFRSPIFGLFITASETYHDNIWYPLVGDKVIKKFLENEWGDVFKDFPLGQPPKYESVNDWNRY
jgi:uncharacterized protein (DUF362 family)